jgi:hypothetical protein
MLSELQDKIVPDEKFQKLRLEEKLLRLSSDLLAAAKQTGVSLPREVRWGRYHAVTKRLENSPILSLVRL